MISLRFAPVLGCHIIHSSTAAIYLTPTGNGPFNLADNIDRHTLPRNSCFRTGINTCQCSTVISAGALCIGCAFCSLLNTITITYGTGRITGLVGMVVSYPPPPYNYHPIMGSERPTVHARFGMIINTKRILQSSLNRMYNRATGVVALFIFDTIRGISIPTIGRIPKLRFCC